jgi:hypothetical protein
MGACFQCVGGPKEVRTINLEVSLLMKICYLNTEFRYSMRKFPPWSNLKHFNHVTTIKFTDGQTFYDILKVNLKSLLYI